MLTKKSEKICKKYSCEICNYITSDKRDFNKHNITAKHILLTQSEKSEEIKHDTYICCKCGKEYKSKQGLWSHSKNCNMKLQCESENIILQQDDDIECSEPIKNYIMKLVEQNNELKNMFIQQNTELMQQNNKHNEELINHNTELQEIKTILAEQPPQQITNIQNNNNKITNQFNLTVFLQQTCKDAMNMSDFIDSLDINNKSLERIGTHGYVHGISKIFIDGIKKLEVHERPIHCSDLKREVMYIKDNNTWTKDDDNKLFNKALEGVVHRNMVQLLKWEEENPETSNPESKNYEFYFVLARQSTGGGNLEVTERNNGKILKAIAQEVHIDRKVKELL